MRDEQDIISIMQGRVTRHQVEPAPNAFPVFLVGLGITERVGFLEEIPAGREAEHVDNLVVGRGPVRCTGRPPCHAHILTLEVPVELLTEVHVTDYSRLALRLVRFKNPLGCYLSPGGVGTIGGFELQVGKLASCPIGIRQPSSVKGALVHP